MFLHRSHSCWLFGVVIVGADELGWGGGVVPFIAIEFCSLLCALVVILALALILIVHILFTILMLLLFLFQECIRHESVFGLVDDHCVTLAGVLLLLL